MKSVTENITIILKQPRYPENIGAAARAMSNMGFSHLVLVSPENYDLARIKKTATHETTEIVDSITIFGSVEEAVSQSEYVVGTTARLGKQRRKASTPATIAERLIPISQNNRIAILFGPEDRGLMNHDISLCDSLVHIPTFGFSSINLAQSVMILCYQIAVSARTEKKSPTPKLAGKNELSEMYVKLEEVLVKTGYVNPENPAYYINSFRDFFSRIQLRSKDVVIIRGVLQKVKSFGEDMYKKGQSGKTR